MKRSPAEPASSGPGSAPPTDGQHVVDRLRSRIREVRAMGFRVRQEILDGHQPTWCEIGGQKTLFLDASQSAREQLASIDEALADYVPARDPVTQQQT